LPSLRKELKALNIRPRKNLGQNFVQDPNVLRKLVDVASLDPDDIVVEIGGGLGSLTAPLADRVKKVYALEIDPRLAQALRVRFSGTDRVEVVLGDALRFEFATLFGTWKRKMKVVANLPYEISSPMIFRLLREREYFSLIVLMLQREVARRVVARPATRDYGPLAIWSQLYSRPSIAFYVAPGSFHPPPKVESAVVKFEILPEPSVPIEDEGALREVIRSAFNYRRKTLTRALQSGSFSHLSRQEIQEAISASRIPPDARGETLSLEQFADLARNLHVKNSK
jgi:16S rRNA (adenine1518-N6/adenine1519-N6)-dimethyltransferase